MLDIPKPTKNQWRKSPYIEFITWFNGQIFTAALADSKLQIWIFIYFQLYFLVNESFKGISFSRATIWTNSWDTGLDFTCRKADHLIPYFMNKFKKNYHVLYGMNFLAIYFRKLVAFEITLGLVFWNVISEFQFYDFMSLVQEKW